MLVWHLIGTRRLPGDVAKTFSVTKLVDKLASKFNRKLHEVPVGFKYICELMLERDILIGGEESGGIGWLMVRASGTENLLRIYSETSNPETTRQVLRAVEAAIHEL